jgi:hypothetical protein
MKQAAFIKFCNSWMERDIVIAQRFGLDPRLKAQAESMLFRQGLSHSNQHTGVFTDQYQRCARIKDPDTSLLYKVVEGLSERFAHNQTFLIPVTDYELAEKICAAADPSVTTSFQCHLKSVKFNHKEILCIQSRLKINSQNPTSLLLDLLAFIAHFGILATQDTLIRILLDLGSNRYIDSMHDRNDRSIANDNIGIIVQDVFQLLRQAPRIAKNLNKNDANSYAFYCSYLESLIEGFCEKFSETNNQVSLSEQLLYMQSLRRLYLKLLIVQDNESNYKECMTALEFAFDEIVNVLSIAKMYNKSALLAAIKQFFCDHIHLPATLAPASVSLAGSCMQIIHRSINSALNYFSGSNGTKLVSAYISSDIYYEVCLSLGITQDFKHDQFVSFNGSQPSCMGAYNGEVVDFMLLHFNANVNRELRGFIGHDVASIIATQFKLREAQKYSGQLVVVLDVALTNLSDVHIRSLLTKMSHHIQSGNLAIIMTTSLNKYCQMGFDRFPSGVSANFYNKKSFHNLSLGNTLTAFEEYDVTPQIVAHCLSHAGTNVLSYYRMVHENSRRIHNHIVPRVLYSDRLPIHIDCPYSTDGYKRPWGFMVIRFGNENLTSKYKPILQTFLDSIGFEYRNGFGFNRSTYTLIGAQREILRISIGPNASDEQYQKLVNFIGLQNHNICKNKPRIRSVL